MDGDARFLYLVLLDVEPTHADFDGVYDTERIPTALRIESPRVAVVRRKPLSSKPERTAPRTTGCVRKLVLSIFCHSFGKSLREAPLRSPGPASRGFSVRLPAGPHQL